MTAISAGCWQSLALTADGRVIAWALNHNGDTFGQADVPTAAQSGVKAVAAGFEHSLALKSDGSVVAWGLGTDGLTAVRRKRRAAWSRSPPAPPTAWR